MDEPLTEVRVHGHGSVQQRSWKDILYTFGATEGRHWEGPVHGDIMKPFNLSLSGDLCDVYVGGSGVEM